ncbi:MAG: hypothetical protein ABIB79_01340 [archaeon]
MIGSIPRSAKELGITHEGYEVLIRLARNISVSSYDEISEILKKAKDPNKKVRKLEEDMCYDREVFDICGLDYSKGSQSGKLFFIAIDAFFSLYKNNPIFVTQPLS